MTPTEQDGDEMSKIDLRQGDCLDLMKDIPDGSVDVIITDPPYGYSFMGKDWDKAVPSVEIWQECLRVLKPGAFACVMSAPRSDVQNAMISRLMEAGFRLDFTPIYWTYASGFPKAGNVGKLVDKRLGAEREVVGKDQYANRGAGINGATFKMDTSEAQDRGNITAPATSQAKALDGSYTGFQPKPAVEVIIVAMKPLSEKTYIDQALKNGKGITWLDDCRVPTAEPSFEKNWTERKAPAGFNGDKTGIYGSGKTDNPSAYTPTGRFPANLLVSDDVLNDGRITQNSTENSKVGQGNRDFSGVTSYKGSGVVTVRHNDSGSYSRYFDLDAWANTLPFLAVPKASKSEKNKGLDGRDTVTVSDGRKKAIDNPFQRGKTERVNSHPTVKPLKLMSYLITLFSRESDTVLDPFMGSGTTGVACKNTNRNFIGIELDENYFEIAKERIMNNDNT